MTRDAGQSFFSGCVTAVRLVVVRAEDGPLRFQAVAVVVAVIADVEADSYGHA